MENVIGIIVIIMLVAVCTLFALLLVQSKKGDKQIIANQQKEIIKLNEKLENYIMLVITISHNSEMEPFKHNFTATSDIIDINRIDGFTQCLNEVFEYIKTVTNYDPAKRYIDAVPLLEKIEVTNAELIKLLLETKIINIPAEEEKC